MDGAAGERFRGTAHSRGPHSPARQGGERVKYWHLCSASLRQIVLAAHGIALHRGSEAIDPEHLMLAMLRLDRCTGCRLLGELGVDIQTLGAALRAEADGALPILPAEGGPGDVRFSAAAERVMQATWLEARRAWARQAGGPGAGRVGSAHLLLGITNPASGIQLRALRTHGVFHGELADRVRRHEAPPGSREAD